MMRHAPPSVLPNAEGAEADRGVVVTADRLNPCAVSTEAARLVVPAMD